MQVPSGYGKTCQGSTDTHLLGGSRVKIKIGFNVITSVISLTHTMVLRAPFFYTRDVPCHGLPSSQTVDSELLRSGPRCTDGLLNSAALDDWDKK